MNKPRKFVDIVIPFYNEYYNLRILIPKIIKTLKKIKKIKYRVIFVNDGSTDGGDLFVKKFQKKKKNFFLVHNKKKSGQTHCYKNYLNKFKSEYFVRMDADNQDDPKYLIDMFHYIEKEYDLILTNRVGRKHSLYMIMLTLLFNSFISLLVKMKLKNYSSSLVGFKRKYLSKKNLLNNDHRYFPIIAIENGAEKIKTFSVIHKKRMYGFTKYGMFKKILFAFPEFLFFYTRLKIGYFKK